MSRNPSICILGASLPSGNMGVQALAASLVTLLERVCPGIEITILCGGQAGTFQHKVFVGEGFKDVTVSNYRMSPRAKWSEHLLVALFAAIVYRAVPLDAVRRRLLSMCPILYKLVSSTHVGDIRGGDSFSDIYGFKRFVSGSLPSLVALIAGKELVLFPQTFGPFKSGLSRFLARVIVRGSRLVLARDKDSLAVANQLLDRKDSRTKVELCPDVAFCLAPLMPAEPAIEPPLPNGSDYQLMGFNVNGLLYYGGYDQNNMFGLQDNYQETTFRVLQFLLSLPNSRIMLVPHMFRFDAWNVESDIHASRHLLERLEPVLRQRVHLAAGDYDQHQVKALIGRCQFFVGSRMHSCIAALSQGIPTAGIAYSRKFKGVFETIGVPEAALDATKLNQEQIIAQIEALYAGAGLTRGLLEIWVPLAKAVTSVCFNRCLGFPVNKDGENSGGEDHAERLDSVDPTPVPGDPLNAAHGNRAAAGTGQLRMLEQKRALASFPVLREMALRTFLKHEN